MAIRVTVWNERELEARDKAQMWYPNGIQNTIKDFLEKDPAFVVTAVNLEQPEQGLPDEILENTDVLLWWQHGHVKDVEDALVERITQRVWRGMGFIPLHSAHWSKPFSRLLGTSGAMHWGDSMKEVVWTIMPSHPIAKGIPEHFVLEEEEMCGEPCEIPAPDELIFLGWFRDGYVCRSGYTYRRGNGKIFVFQPGHEQDQSLHNEYVQKIITNAVHWAAPDKIWEPMQTEMTLNFND